MCIPFFDIKLTLSALALLYGVATVLTLLRSPHGIGDSAPLTIGFLFVSVGGFVAGVGFISSTGYQIYKGVTAKELAVIERERPYTEHVPLVNSWNNFPRFLARPVEASDIGARL